ncbi:hypothetical protein TNCV_3846941 [Trichonephila clavipes]|nr:hypothetical protein TNCV_3846941 [Trichonephila clavipes]
MSRSNSASEVDFLVDRGPEDYPLAVSRWIEEYIGHVDDEERIHPAHGVSQVVQQPPNNHLYATPQTVYSHQTPSPTSKTLMIWD